MLGAKCRLLRSQLNISSKIIVPSFAVLKSISPTGESTYARETWKEWAMDINEWLGMLMVDADRVKANDRVDPYLCTYVPNSASEPRDVVQIQWRGMIPSCVIHKTWTDLWQVLISHNINTRTKLMVSLLVKCYPRSLCMLKHHDRL